MLPTDAFVTGLASFLGAHIAYIAGFSVLPWHPRAFAASAIGVLLLLGVVGTIIVRAVRRANPKLGPPVVVYMTTISVMVIFAISRGHTATGRALSGVGALLFFSSDALIAWDRFVKPLRWARPAIMATYHLAQAGLVLSLVR